MRLLRLGLEAFGPFTDTELDLSGPSLGGLHVIYGRNEAGKSTALRAVSGLLFGIAERTGDAHVHPARDLRLSATLEHAGRELSILRRKRRKDALRTPNDEPLPEAALVPFLHGVDQTVFHSLFGLDHERLKHGGQALLEGQGDVGVSLFDAGTGGAGIHGVLGELEREAELLFKVRASKPTLNAAISDYRAAKKEVRERIRVPEKYLEQRGQLEQAKAQSRRLAERRAELRERQERLEQIRATLPGLARRQQTLDELALLVEVPALPEGSQETRLEVERLLAESERDLSRSERELQRKQGMLARLPGGSQLVELSRAQIDDLRDRVGIHRKAAQDLPKRRAEIKHAEAEARRILVRMKQPAALEAAERLRLPSAQLAKIRRLGRNRVELNQQRDHAAQRFEQAHRELSEYQRQLAEHPPESELDKLEAAVAGAAASLNLEARIEELAQRSQELSVEASDLEARLFHEPPLQQGRLTVLEVESIEAFAERFGMAQRREERLVEELEQARRKLADAARQREAIERQGPVPSEEQLQQVRGERQASFAVLVEHGQRGELSDESVLGYQQLVVRSDELADRLRCEAARVAELAQVEATHQYWCERVRSLEHELERVRADREQLEAAWQREWAGVPARLGSPGEMLAWRRRFDVWQNLKLEHSRLTRHSQALAHERADQMARLGSALQESGASVAAIERSSEVGLVALVEQARNLLGRLTQRERERQTLVLTLRRLEGIVAHERQMLAALEPALDAWSEEWSQTVEPLGLGEVPGTDEVLAMLDDLVELYRKLDELPDKRRRVAGIERDAAAFEELLLPLLAKYAPDLMGEPIDVAAERFAARYGQATAQAEERVRLAAELEELEAERARHHETRARVRREVARLLQRSGARDLAELEALEQRWQRKQALESKLREIEAQLLDLGGGASLEALVVAASTTDRAKLNVDLDELKAELEDVETGWRKAEVDIVGLEQGLLYYSDESAALAAQQVEQRAAHVRELLERYLKVRLAKTILEQEIQRYRERHQGPVLARASELFRRLTLERYRGLRVGIEERSLSMLRADGDEVSVAQLSEGTQYQLYLALRLATLEHFIETNAPVPLVFDDLLIHFDDERASAAFAVLGELAERVQVLYFTHLSRDLSLSERMVPATLLRQHRLTHGAARDEARGGASSA